MALSESDIQKLADSIVHGAEERMVAELAASLVDSLANGAMGLAGEAALEQLARSNAPKAEEVLAKWARRIDGEVRERVEDALAAASEADEESLAAAYGQGASEAAASLYAAGYSAHFAEMAAQAASGVAGIIRRQNLAMARAAERLWYEVAGEAVAAFSQGLLPREECVARAVSRLMAEGMETVDYASGVRSQLDVAVRRHVVTQASQAGGRMTLERMEAYGHELVVTSSHYGARPGHAEWQGLPCAVHGAAEVGGVRYPGLAELTGYGTVGGLKGANCRHSISPYHPGVTPLPAREWPEHEARFGMSSEEYYEATQRQRELERRVRKTKREIAGMEQAGIGLESPTYVQKRLVLGRQQAALRDHCAKNKLVRQYGREKAYGVESQPRALRNRRRPDVRIGRSVGAAAFRDVVAIPASLTGMSAPITVKIAEGSRITAVTVIAGKGSRTPIRGEMESLREQYPDVNPSEWSKMAGKGWIEDMGLERRVELHWYQCEQAGRVRMKVKRYL